MLLKRIVIIEPRQPPEVAARASNAEDGIAGEGQWPFHVDDATIGSRHPGDAAHPRATVPFIG